MREVHALIRTLFAGPKPVIAAVEGLAFGGGFSIAPVSFRTLARTWAQASPFVALRSVASSSMPLI